MTELGGDVVLNAQDVHFRYVAPRGRKVLAGTSLQLRRGEFLGIAGPNGAGKSTLLHILTGYLSPEAGGVLLFDRQVSQLTRREISQQVAFVAQKSAVSFPFTVLEMVLMGRQPYVGLAAYDTPEDLAIARQALDALGLSGMASRNFDRLSGGRTTAGVHCACNCPTDASPDS